MMIIPVRTKFDIYVYSYVFIPSIAIIYNILRLW
jgi:hypothetical protein